MAQVTSGSFATGGYSGRHLLFEWTGTQSIANNTTTISWTLKGAGNAPAAWYQSGNFKVVIAGEVVYSSATRIKLYNGTVVASGTKTIAHNTSGAKSFSASAEAGIYTVAVNCSGSATWELKTIARGATITSAPNFTDEENPTLSFSNPAGTAATSLQAWLSVDGGATKNIVRDISNKTATSCTFSLSDAERKILRKAATQNTLTVTFGITSVVSGSTFTSYMVKSMTIVNAAPTVTASVVVPMDSETYSLTGDTTALIKNYSWIPYTMSVAAQKEATIVSHVAAHGGVKNTALSGLIPISVQNETVTFTATDSRGNTTTKNVTVKLIDYFKPSAMLEVAAPTTAGATTLTVSGNWFNGSFGVVNNALIVQYRYRENDNAFSAWTNLTITSTGNTYTAEKELTGLNYQNRYTFEISVVDTISQKTQEYIYRSKTVKTTPVYDWGENDFSVNVPMSIEGQPVADFVVEQGSSGDWTYRKWNSGKAECWCQFTLEGVNVAEFHMNGMYYCGSKAKAYPFTFASVTYTAATGGSTASMNFVRSFHGSNSQMTFVVCGFDGAQTSATVRINLEAKGTWK